jgi:serine protease
MKTKITLLLFLITFFWKVSAGQNEHCLFQNNDYVKIDGQWKVLSTQDLQYYPIRVGHVSVKFNAEFSEAILGEFVSKFDLGLQRSAPTGWYDFKMGGSADYFQQLEAMKAYYAVALVEIAVMGTYDADPNDPMEGLQWGLDKIDAQEAWDLETGSPDVIVAIIDSGTDWSHEDMGYGTDSYQNIYLNNAENDWVNPNIPGGDGVDNDMNGYVDDWKGWDFADDDNDSRSTHEHGTKVAGLLGAKTHNGKGICGVAGGWNNEGVKMMILGVGHEGPISSAVDDAIIYAAANGAKIIQLSLSLLWSQAVSDALYYVNDNYDVIVVCSSGNWGLAAPPEDPNDPNAATNVVLFPSSHPTVISVGSTNEDDIRNPNSNYGDALFITAPGRAIRTTQSGNSYITDAFLGATSYAAPIVSGVIALMYSINPCLTRNDVREILKNTADKVGGYDYYIDPMDPGHNDDMGYGRINAFDAVSAAFDLTQQNVDLIVKDTPNDPGAEPNVTSAYFWGSEDIWIRNNPDGLINTTTENPEYSPTNPTYVYVRVTNNSCTEYPGGDKVSAYWSKAGTGLNWDHSWNGSWVISSVTMGDHIGTMLIPALQPGEEFIAEFPWQTQNPANFASIPGASNFITDEPWHFCLLARIESDIDPMTFPETIDLVQNVIDNNNIAWKNITIVDLVQPRGNDIGGIVSVTNPFTDNHTFNIEFLEDEVHDTKPLVEEAEIGIEMNDILHAAWVQGGSASDGIKGSRDEMKFVATGKNAVLKNIKLSPEDLGMLCMRFNFLSKETSSKSEFKYVVILRDAETNKIVGGETYVIKRTPRSNFVANVGGDKDVDKNEKITVAALNVGEEASYAWYDSEGNVICKEKEIEIAVSKPSTFRLEITALADGYKDYTDFIVNLKPSSISNLSPNPASNEVKVNYKLNQDVESYLLVIPYYTSDNNFGTKRFDLNSGSEQLTIDIDSYPSGFYTVALVCDGVTLDAKSLMIE